MSKEPAGKQAASSGADNDQSNTRAQDNEQDKEQEQEQSARSTSKPRRPRPVRVAKQLQQQQVGVPLRAQMELAAAAGALHSAPIGRSSVSPPKRPAHLPARFHPRSSGPAQTSLGANVTTNNSGGASDRGERPNRYSWLQMQQWHARQQQQQAAAALAAAAAASSTSADVPLGPQAAGQQAGFHFHHHFPSSPFASAASRVLYVNPIANLGNFQHTKSRLIKFIEALKRFSEKWFSHVLLLMFLAVYACLGAYVFISFEASTEQYEKQQIIDLRSSIVDEAYEAARSASERAHFVDSFATRFEEYERLLNRVCASGISSSSLENQWTFWGGIFYSMTVFTTIGYGHLTPVTFAGRVATMVYAIFGIPILLMVLADLGKLLTRIIKFAFKKFNYIYNKLLGRRAPVRLRTQQLISDNTSQYFGVARDAFERGFAHYIQPYQNRLPGRLKSSSRAAAEQQQQRPAPAPAPASPVIEERDPQLESSDVIVTPHKQSKAVSPPQQTSSSSKDKKQQQQRRSQSPSHHLHHHGQWSSKRKISESKRAKAAVSRSSSANNVLETSSSQQSCKAAGARAASNEQAITSTGSTGAVDEQQIIESRAQAPAASGPGSQASEYMMDEEEEQARAAVEAAAAAAAAAEQELLEEDEDDFDIPVSFALFLLITYMMAGAFVFSIWEGWNFFDALYFVFISMSTIGFGDLVPQHPKRMVGTFAYLLFGLALTSMCINVVQEKIHASFLRAKMQIGEKMGFDLEQIMADDYYGDAQYYDEEHCENDSTGVSSSSAVGQSVAAVGALDAAPSEAQQQQQHAIAKSKSKDSLKGLAANLGAKSKANSSFRRKSMSANTGKQQKQQQQRNATNSSAATQSSQIWAANQQAPIRAQLETIKMSGLSSSSSLGPTRPSINQPVAASVVGYCEPIRRAFQTAQLNESKLAGPAANPALLVASKSLDSRPTTATTLASSSSSNNNNNNKSNNISSSASNFFNRNATHRRTTAGRESDGANSDAARDKGRRMAATTRRNGSLGATPRRASVSHELSQLDDLIVSLSEWPPERFAPLLGVPAGSARTSCSVTPGYSTPVAQSTSASPGRRGTSMVDGRSSSSRQLDRQRSAVARASSAATSSSASSVTHRSNSGARPAAAKQRRAFELNLSESQAALDELEAIKFSAL